MKRAVVCAYLLSNLCCLPLVSGMIEENRTKVLNSLKKLASILSFRGKNPGENGENLSKLCKHVIAIAALDAELKNADGLSTLLNRAGEVYSPLLRYLHRLDADQSVIAAGTLKSDDKKKLIDSESVALAKLWIDCEALSKTLIKDIENNKI